MVSDLRSRGRLLALATTAAALVITVLAAPDVDGAVPGCPSFGSQAAAQDYFVAAGGNPRKRVGSLDPDRDGVACEGQPGPYKGFTTIGYNKRKKFLYGLASMPSSAAGGFPCLEGNPAFPDGPRRLNVYRAQPGADLLVLGPVGAASDSNTGRLVWKADKAVLAPGRYYAVFEERIPLAPYGPNECPGFRSAEVGLP